MVSVPGDHVYDVLYRATADFEDVLRKIAELNAALDTLDRRSKTISQNINTSGTNDLSKAIQDQQRLRTETDNTAKAIDREAQARTLLNKAENMGFNDPLSKYNFDERLRQQQIMLNRARNRDYATMDQYLAKLREEQVLKATDNRITQDAITYSDGLARSIQNTARAFEQVQRAQQQARNVMSAAPSGLPPAIQSQSVIDDFIRSVESSKGGNSDLSRTSGDLSTQFKRILAQRTQADIQSRIDTLNGADVSSAASIAQIQSLITDLDKLQKAAAGDKGVLDFVKSARNDLASLGIEIDKNAAEWDLNAREVGIFGSSLKDAGLVADLVSQKFMEDYGPRFESFKDNVANMPFDKAVAGLQGFNKELVAAAKANKENSNFQDWVKVQLASLDNWANKISYNAEELKKNADQADALASKFKEASTVGDYLAQRTLTDITAKMQMLGQGFRDGKLSADDLWTGIAHVDSELNKLSKATGVNPAFAKQIESARQANFAFATSVFNSRTELEKFNTITENSAKKADTAANSWKNLWGYLKFVRVSVEDLGASFDKLGTKISGAGGGGGGFFSGLASGAGGVFGSASSFIGTAITGVGAISALVTQIVLLATVIPAAISAIVGLGIALTGLLGALAPLVGIFATWIPLIVGFAGSMAVLYGAVKPVTQAITALGKATNQSQVEAALKGLSPAAANAALALREFGVEFSKALKGTDLQTGFWENLVKPLQQLPEIIKPIMQFLVPLSKALGTIFSALITNLEQFVTSPGFNLFGSYVTASVENLGLGLANVLKLLGQIGEAAAPFAKLFSEDFLAATQDLLQSFQKAEQSGAVKDFFYQMVTAGHLSVSIFTDLLAIFAKLGEGFATVGNFMLDNLFKGLEKLSNYVGKIDFKDWARSAMIFLGGIGSFIGQLVVGVLSLGAHQQLLVFIGTVFKDLSMLIPPIARGLNEIVQLFLPLLPPVEKFLGSVTNGLVRALNDIDNWLASIEKNRAGADVLKTLVGLMGSVVVAASALAFLDKLKDLTTANVSKLVDLLNKLPGINLPGGSVGQQTASEAMQAAGDTMIRAATLNQTAADTMLRAAQLNEAGAAAGAVRGAEGAAGAEAGAVGGAEAGAAGGGLLSRLGSLLGKGIGGAALGGGVALLGNSLTNQFSRSGTAPNEAGKIGSDAAGGAIFGASVGGPWGAVIGGLAGALVGVFTDSKLRNAVGSFFKNTVAGGFMRDVADPISRFFTGSFVNFFKDTIGGGFMRDVATPVENFFTKTIPGWFKGNISGLSNFGLSIWHGFDRDFIQPIHEWFTHGIGKDILGILTLTRGSGARLWFDLWHDFDHDFVQPMKGFFTTDIPHWFMNVYNWWTRDVITPFHDFITKTLPKFFTDTIPHWFDSVSNWWTKDVVTPVHDFIVKSIPSFFTNTIPHWFDSVSNWWTRDVVSPVHDFIVKSIPNFFTSTIPHWFDSVSNWWTKDVITPFHDFITKSIPSFFDSTIPHWFDSFGTWWTKSVVTPINHFFTKDLPSMIEGAFKGAFNWVIQNVVGAGPGPAKGGILGMVNRVTGVVNIPPIPGVPLLATGGPIDGPIKGKDSVLIAAMPDEYVIRAAAARKLGLHRLDLLNQADKLDLNSIPGFAAGGPLSPDFSNLPPSAYHNLPQGGPSNPGGLAVIGNAFKSAIQFGVSLIQGAMRSGFDTIWGHVAQPLLNLAGSGLPGTAVKFAGANIKSGIDSLLGAKDTAAAKALGGTIPAGQHKAIIDAALQAAGVPQSQWSIWEAGLNTLIGRESGWDVAAVNLSDSNFLAGHPSQGLAQVIPSTFAAYHVAGTSNSIIDPVANVAAAIKYIEARYGDIQNVQQANANLPPKGYAFGGVVGDRTFSVPDFDFGTRSWNRMRPTDLSALSDGARAAMGASGGSSYGGTNIENLTIHNPIPEPSRESLQRMNSRLRVYGGRG